MVTPAAAFQASGPSEFETTVHTVAPGATKVALPDGFSLTDAQFNRHGDDLTVTSPDGH